MGTEDERGERGKKARSVPGLSKSRMTSLEKARTVPGLSKSRMTSLGMGMESVLLT